MSDVNRSRLVLVVALTVFVFVFDFVVFVMDFDLEDVPFERLIDFRPTRLEFVDKCMSGISSRDKTWLFCRFESNGAVPSGAFDENVELIFTE